MLYHQHENNFYRFPVKLSIENLFLKTGARIPLQSGMSIIKLKVT